MYNHHHHTVSDENNFTDKKIVGEGRKSVVHEELVVNREFTVIEPCLPCKNGDFPTGIHRCEMCNKAIHLFGCSIQSIHSEEGFGESRICLSCAQTSKECEAVEHWQKKRKSSIPPQCRSTESYLVPQPGFDHLDLNEKVTKSSKVIVFLKNSNTFSNKPHNLPNIGKVILTNTCSPDSLLSILACAAADSNIYFKFLSNKEKQNKTAKFILNMISPKMKNNMNRERILLLAPFFLSTNECIGDIKVINAMNTISSTANKLLKKMPSYKTINQCSNYLCPEFSIDPYSYEVIKLNAFDGHINIQNEMDVFLAREERNCDKCDSKRIITVSIKTHILIELVSLPRGK